MGFGVEFDVRLDCAKTRLVLSHDPAPWHEERDAVALLREPAAGALHALNVKSLYTVPAITSTLRQAGTMDRFFLFDFELVSEDPAGCSFLMRSLSDEGFEIAYRLSEREPFFDRHLQDPAVTCLWMDEFDTPWITEKHVRALTDAGKRTFYVSPELHGCHDLAIAERRWAQMAAWGIAGICTDYPIRLKQLFGDPS